MLIYWHPMDITFQRGDGGMALQEWQASVLINKAGGATGLEGKSYRIVLSPVRTKQLGITENNHEILLQFVENVSLSAELVQRSILAAI